MYEYDLFKKLIDDEMINFNAILIKYYKKLGLNEKDLIVLSYLSRQETKGNYIFNPARMVGKIDLEKGEIFDSLDRLVKKKYLEIREEKNPKTDKEVEMFSIDNLYKAAVDLYISGLKKANEKINLSFQEEVANYYEELYGRQITPQDIEVIRTWAQNREFTLDEIKNEMANSAKLGKASLKYVDSKLISKLTEKKQSPEYKEINQIIKELSEKWKH